MIDLADLLLGGGALYCIFFALLGTWVYVDACRRQIPARRHAFSTVVFGWAGLSLYLLSRRG